MPSQHFYLIFALKMKPTSILASLLLLISTACGNEQADYASCVNLMVGTAGNGDTQPSATLPHGMISPAPDTRIDSCKACRGYNYADSCIAGFSHTHLGDVVIMPTVGSSLEEICPQHFAHADEVAEPGYYSVQLRPSGVRAELTASARSAMHRYTFPGADDAGFMLSLGYAAHNAREETDIDLQVLSDTEICGSKIMPMRSVHFYAKFSKPFTYKLVTDTAQCAHSMALLHFHTCEGEQVMVKVGISAVDGDGARRNVESEIPRWDFERVRADARAEWNNYLSNVDVSVADSRCSSLFYTALYRTALGTQLVSDADGRYRGLDMEVHDGRVGEPLYSVSSVCDTYCSCHPLLTIIDSGHNDACVRSLLQMSHNDGMLPSSGCALVGSGSLMGCHAASLFADAYAKGSQGFDPGDALQACRAAAECAETSPSGENPVQIPPIASRAKYWKEKVGYVPCDKDSDAVAKALAFAYDDWCIARLADAAGDEATRDRYRAFAGGYRVYFDPATRFMRGIDSKGCWREPFSPLASGSGSHDYYGGSAWQWTWMVPHDVEGLIGLMGGRDSMAEKLDSLFSIPGQYSHASVHCHHITHLYNYVGRSYRTQELVDSVLRNCYANAPDGLSGSDRSGCQSAWYVLNALGFYQVCPGQPVYSVSRPLVDRAVVHLAGGRKFVIEVRNNSPRNRYVGRIALNGKLLTEPFFDHSAIVHGGKLEIDMCDTTVKN